MKYKSIFNTIFGIVFFMAVCCSVQPAKAANPNMGDQAVWGGAEGEVFAEAVAADDAGNVYVTGYFTGKIKFPNTVLTSKGGTDVFLCKFTDTGMREHYLSISDPSSACKYTGIQGPNCPRFYNNSQGPIHDTKLEFQWAISWGGLGDDKGLDIEVHIEDGSMYVLGSFEGDVNFDLLPHTTKKTSIGKSDIFLSILKNGIQPSNLPTFYQTFTWGGKGNDVCTSISRDGGQYLIIAGTIENPDTFSFSPNYTFSGGITPQYPGKFAIAIFIEDNWSATTKPTITPVWARAWQKTAGVDTIGIGALLLRLPPQECVAFYIDTSDSSVCYMRQFLSSSPVNFSEAAIDQINLGIPDKSKIEIRGVNAENDYIAGVDMSIYVTGKSTHRIGSSVPALSNELLIACFHPFNGFVSTRGNSSSLPYPDHAFPNWSIPCSDIYPGTDTSETVGNAIASFRTIFDYDSGSSGVYQKGRIYVTGEFSGKVCFNPDWQYYFGNPLIESVRESEKYLRSEDYSKDMFILMMNDDGKYMGVYTSKGKGDVIGKDVYIDRYGDIYVVGTFTKDFDLISSDTNRVSNFKSFICQGSTDSFLIKMKY